MCVDENENSDNEIDGEMTFRSLSYRELTNEQRERVRICNREKRSNILKDARKKMRI